MGPCWIQASYMGNWIHTWVDVIMSHWVLDTPEQTTQQLGRSATLVMRARANRAPCGHQPAQLRYCEYTVQMTDTVNTVVTAWTMSVSGDPKYTTSPTPPPNPTPALWGSSLRQRLGHQPFAKGLTQWLLQLQRLTLYSSTCSMLGRTLNRDSWPSSENQSNVVLLFLLECAVFNTAQAPGLSETDKSQSNNPMILLRANDNISKCSWLLFSSCCGCNFFHPESLSRGNWMETSSSSCWFTGIY